MVDTSSSGDDRGQRATTDTAPFPLAPGALINGLYRLVRQLGVGGMGEVWEARHERTKGRVALKVLLPEMGRHDEVLRRFQREVEVTSALNHPNIVRVSDADKLPDGRPYLVMEFLEGHDLTTVAGRALPLGEVADIVEQTAMGLHVAHGHFFATQPALVFQGTGQATAVPSAIALGDVNGDGKADLAVLALPSSDAPTFEVFLYLNTSR